MPIGNWLDLVIKKAPRASISIDASAEDAPDTVHMDPRLMELALSNLLVNATKYADQHVRCSLVQEDDDYVLTVEDDGKGIPEDEREAVFKAFTRIDDSRNRETGGYGLGLYLCRMIAEAHGGELAISSQVGKGTSITVRLPR